MDTCNCETCGNQRQKFENVLDYISKGQGQARKKIVRNTAKIPESFINDMRKLLVRMRKEGNPQLLTKNQLNFFRTYKRVLSNFVRPNPRDLLIKKRKFNNKNEPFSVAFAKTYIENPSAFKKILSTMNFH